MSKELTFVCFSIESLSSSLPKMSSKLSCHFGFVLWTLGVHDSSVGKVPSRMLGRLWVGLSIALEDKSRLFGANFAVFIPQPGSASGKGVHVMEAEMWPPTHDTGMGDSAPWEWLASGPASWCS